MFTAAMCCIGKMIGYEQVTGKLKRGCGDVLIGDVECGFD